MICRDGNGLTELVHQLGDIVEDEVFFFRGERGRETNGEQALTGSGERLKVTSEDHSAPPFLFQEVEAWDA
jgi:hypothetical protein